MHTHTPCLREGAAVGHDHLDKKHANPGKRLGLTLRLVEYVPVKCLYTSPCNMDHKGTMNQDKVCPNALANIAPPS